MTQLTQVGNPQSIRAVPVGVLYFANALCDGGQGSGGCEDHVLRTTRNQREIRDWDNRASEKSERNVVHGCADQSSGVQIRSWMRSNESGQPAALRVVVEAN